MMIVVPTIICNGHPAIMLPTSYAFLSLHISLSHSKYLPHPLLRSLHSVEAHTSEGDWCSFLFLWWWCSALHKHDLLRHQVDIVDSFILVAL